MNTNHNQTKRDHSYLEWSDNMQIVRKGNGDTAMMESELVDFFGNMEETQLSSATASENRLE